MMIILAWLVFPCRKEPRNVVTKIHEFDGNSLHGDKIAITLSVRRSGHYDRVVLMWFCVGILLSWHLQYAAIRHDWYVFGFHDLHCRYVVCEIPS